MNYLCFYCLLSVNIHAREQLSKIKEKMTLFSCMYFLSLFMILQRPAAFEKTCSSCNRINFNVKNGVRDRALGDDRRLKNTMVENDSQCFYECYKDCKCLSFNVCGKTCQLNRANKLSAKTSFQVKDGCRYYDFPAAEVSVDNKDLLYVLTIALNFLKNIPSIILVVTAYRSDVQ